jgi:tape measure domain-containing protein
MKFDNKEFEKNIAQSLSTLDKLKAALNLKPVDSLKEIGAATKNFNMDGVKTATEGCTKRFYAMEIVGITALANIANRAVNCGVQLVKSLSIAPIKDGFNEYEMKMGSIQTIMASTGESIQKVNGYLNELNTYSDKTIYSFADMTNNIGKFTNAGVKLDRAVKAIQGIANEAAVSGANANEASRAMYNFAQALSAGYVKLIDWKSIENANMATVEFKQQLLDTAEAMGTVVKIGDKYQTTTKDLQGKVSGLFDATHGFNDALSNQWMTTEVLSQTLENYATDTREMTEAEKDAWRVKMKSIGYTEQQINAIEKLG